MTKNTENVKENNISDIHVKQLNKLKQLFNESERSKAELSDTIKNNTLKIETVNRAYNQAITLARELENKALTEAHSIMSEALNKKNEIEEKITEIDDEISFLKEELQLIKSVIENSSLALISEPPKKNPDLKAAERTSGTVAEKSEEPYYIIKLLAFLNARHFVIFGDKLGPVHAHSWQMKVDVKVPANNPKQIAFNDILMKIKTSLDTYENSLLNEKSPFDSVMPTTENIAGVLYEKIEREISTLGIGLVRLSVWESPTKGIEVSGVPGNLKATNTNYKPVNVPAYQETVQVQAAATSPDEVKDGACPDKPLESNKKTFTGGYRHEETYPITFSVYKYPIFIYLLSGAMIVAALVAAYHNILFPPADKIYPWGSDIWAHLHKAENLYRQILNGNFIPQFDADWNNGWQPFRYWPPLAYYPLVLIRAITGNIFTASNLYIFFCSLAGSLFWLAFAKRMGIWAATLIGILWAVWPDNVNVAMASGNLPRVMSNALLPLLFFFLLRSVEEKRIKYILLTIIIVHLVVLCHPMFGAIFCISLTLFAVFLFIFGGCSFWGAVRGVTTLALGVLTTAWWLLPGLSGGAAEIDPEAVKLSVKFLSPLDSFNPLVRFTNIELFYWGISLLIGVTLSVIYWKSKPPWAKSLLLCGLIFVIYTFPVSRFLYLAMPLGHLIWPLRFSSIAAMSLLVSSFSFMSSFDNSQKYKTIMITTILFAVMMVDSYFSLSMVKTRQQPSEIVYGAELLKNKLGWRVATLDNDRLESGPSFYFSELSDREQVFGSSYQGSHISQNIMLINRAIEKNYYQYVFRSLSLLGATDLVILKDIIKDKEAFSTNSEITPYRELTENKRLWYWHGLDQPYLLEASDKCLAIGRHASILGTLFPSVEIGRSWYVDDYSLAELERYPTVVLTGANWHSKKKAENLIKEHAGKGHQVFVDMTGLPEKVLARQPNLFDIYGESIDVKKPPLIKGNDGEYELVPFAEEFNYWKCYIPQGLDNIIYSFNHLGANAAVLGYKEIGMSKIYFLGGNLIYHTYLTGDPAGFEILQKTLGLHRQYEPLNTIPLSEYSINQDGYFLSYITDRDIDAILPFAALDGYEVKIDGEVVSYSTFENLIRLHLPEGEHTVELALKEAPVYVYGRYVTAASIPLVSVYLIFLRKRRGIN